ncbi:hypothetical protein CUU64_16325 [Bacillus sp. V5-8f]|nr:hypothetical protein CUU64_16325 [Bacillus sp. V5-8f]
MLQTNYEEKIAELRKKGELEIPVTDCDLQFFIEDTLESLNLKYQKLVPPRKTKRSGKLLRFKILD